VKSEEIILSQKRLSKRYGHSYLEIVLIGSYLSKPLGTLQSCLKTFDRPLYIACMEVDSASCKIDKSRMLLIIAQRKLRDAPLKRVHRAESCLGFKLLDVQ
jgi:hypothetical protein